MNSSGTSATKSTTTLAGVRRASTWIERFAVPIALSAMEAQAIALVVVLLTLMVIGAGASAPLGVGSIALIALGLLWWAMLVEHIIRGSSRGRRAAWLHLLGWLVALVVVVGARLPSLLTGENIFAVLLDTALVTWLWRRNMHRAQMGLEYGQLATSFKVGFGVLLGILLIVVVLPELQALRDALAAALPAFFLSGLVGLSLARLGAIRSARRSLDGSQADPTRAWLLALTLFGVILIAIVIAIEALFSFASFELVLTALTALWNALGMLVGWILYGIILIVLSPIFYLFSWLIGLLTKQPPSQQKPESAAPKQSPFIHQPWNPQAISPEVLAIGRWIFLALALMVVLLMVRASLRRWFSMSNDEEIEEVREGLEARSLLGQRWREWLKRWGRGTNDISMLEPLDPASARAHYREMLQAIAVTKDDLARTPAETPTEYEARLLAYLGKDASYAQHHTYDDVPPAPAMLDELTQAYADERYGGKPTDQRQRVHLQAWVPRLIVRLTGRASNDASRRSS